MNTTKSKDKIPLWKKTREILMMITRMIDVKANYKNKYRNLECNMQGWRKHRTLIQMQKIPWPEWKNQRRNTPRSPQK